MLSINTIRYIKNILLPNNKNINIVRVLVDSEWIYIDLTDESVLYTETLYSDVNMLPDQIPERTWAEFIAEGGKFVSKQEYFISLRKYVESIPAEVLDPDEPIDPPIIVSPSIRFVSKRER